MEKQKIEFNTGRHYGPEGQIIQAELVRVEACQIFGADVYVVRFNDLTRCIRGEVTVLEFSESEIMAKYDAGRYALI